MGSVAKSCIFSKRLGEAAVAGAKVLGTTLGSVGARLVWADIGHPTQILQAVQTMKQVMTLMNVMAKDVQGPMEVHWGS